MSNFTNCIDLFYPGYLGSKNYRIPALMTTNKGTLLASIDARIFNGNDSPNRINTAIRRSEDGGKTWEEGKIVINYPEEASTIDTCLVQLKETERIFLLVTHFPSGYGCWQAKLGTGYTKETNKLILIDNNDNNFFVDDNGRVYDKDNNITEYSIDNKKNLYKDNIKIDNVLTSTSPLKILGTSYLNLIYSDDNGITWSEPRELNLEVKSDWMKFMGVGPGRGIQIENGQYRGRVIFPIYYTNKDRYQSCAVIYSDDNGVSWHRGESPNDGRDVGEGKIIYSQTLDNINYELTESQLVEMPNGSLKYFMRNRCGYVAIATSFDGGETWYKDVHLEEKLPDPYCQLTVINYSKKIDGKDALIFANAASNTRIDGTVRIGLIEESGCYENGQCKYEIDWKYSKLVKPGYYAYSCLTELPNGNIGLFYEGTEVDEMTYIELSIEEIMKG